LLVSVQRYGSQGQDGGRRKKRDDRCENEQQAATARSESAATGNNRNAWSSPHGVARVVRRTGRWAPTNFQPTRCAWTSFLIAESIIRRSRVRQRAGTGAARQSQDGPACPNRSCDAD
jgi:hypothetical protein